MSKTVAEMSTEKWMGSEERRVNNDDDIYPFIECTCVCM